jgi:tetratricopeptide (TPR) repeat protein
MPVESLPFPLEGPLQEGVLSTVLRNIYLGRRTGLLHIRNGKERGSVCFVEGHIVYGDTTIEECHMGDTLVRHGMLSPQDLGRSLDMMRSQGRRLGEVLIELKILDRERLQEALALQVRELLRCVFAWREGVYTFEERGPDAFRGYDRPLPLPTGEVILDAVWSVTDPQVLRYALGNLDRVLAATTDPLLRFQRVTLGPADGFVLSRVDGTLTAREVLEVTAFTREEAERSLFGLLCIGMLEYVEGAPAQRPEDSGREAVRAAILDAHAHITSRDHFQVLGVARTAGAAEVKAAFLRLAKQFHPDVHHQPALADLRDKLTGVFARITEAYQVLSEPVARAAYEAAQQLHEPRAPVAPAIVAAPAPPEPPADPSWSRQQAEDTVAKAEGHYAEGRYWDVLQILEDSLLASLSGRPASRARTLKAQCYLKNPHWQKQAEEELKAVIMQDPGYPEAFFLLGTIYRAAGAKARAATMFRKVLELKPRHAGAREELAALEGTTLPTGSGLLGKFLRRG